MSYSARILADSWSPEGIRLTTMEVTFPRFLLAEMNTHRMFSRNSASSRAIPTEKLIRRVREEPFVPETFNKRVKGMGVGDALDADEARRARQAWEHGALEGAFSAEKLMDIGLDKSRANRLLEPFVWHTAIISATEWDNFFALRDHPAAQPEMQRIACLMREEWSASTPTKLDHGQWHLPLVTDEELARLCGYRESGDPAGDEYLEQLKLVSLSRCARVSFDKHTDAEPLEDTLARARRLLEAKPPHLSPAEHVARPFHPDEWALVSAAQEALVREAERLGVDPDQHLYQMQFSGNFRGWVQMRKEIPNEHNAVLVL